MPDFGDDVWRGYSFDPLDWQNGVDEAAMHLKNTRCRSIPKDLTLWELIKPEYLPWWMPLKVALLRFAFDARLICRPYRSPLPQTLTIGYYGLGDGTDAGDIPF